MKKEKEIEILFNFWMPESLKKELHLLAVREGSTMKDILNEQALEYIKKHKNGNPQHLITSSIENDDFVGIPLMALDFINKKRYIKKNLTKDDRLNKLGKEVWGHICQWSGELQKY